MNDDAIDAGGYGKPPKRHRYGQGQPRNTRGRPRGAKNTKTIVHQIAHEQHLVKVDGETVSYTTAELLFIALSRKAMKGDVRASRLLDKYRALLQLERDERPAGYLVVWEQMSLEAWETHNRAREARQKYKETLARVGD